MDADKDLGTYIRHSEKMKDQCTLDSGQSIMENMELEMAGMSKKRNKVDR